MLQATFVCDQNLATMEPPPAPKTATEAASPGPKRATHKVVLSPGSESGIESLFHDGRVAATLQLANLKADGFTLGKSYRVTIEEITGDH